MIEDSFNTQKNRGYHLKHKFSRKSYRAMQNWYQCMQIAHLINQLLEHSQHFRALLKETKNTTEYLWKLLFAFLVEGFLNEVYLKEMQMKKTQFRYS